MPAHDVFHAAVKQGLIKEGWTITDDPLVIIIIIYDPESEALVQWIK
jgi:hypothetical protein